MHVVLSVPHPGGGLLSLGAIIGIMLKLGGSLLSLSPPFPPVFDLIFLFPDDAYKAGCRLRPLPLHTPHSGLICDACTVLIYFVRADKYHILSRLIYDHHLVLIVRTNLYSVPTTSAQVDTFQSLFVF